MLFNPLCMYRIIGVCLSSFNWFLCFSFSKHILYTLFYKIGKIEEPDLARIKEALGENSPEYAAFEKLRDEAGDISIATAFENQIGRFFRPEDVKAYAAANGYDLTPKPIDIANANEYQLKYRSEYLDRATKQLNLKYNEATDDATHQEISDDIRMIKWEQEAIAKRHY